MSQVAETRSDEYMDPPRILIMEDESSVAQGLQMVLEEGGYGVDWAMSGKSALDNMRDRDFDLMVADLRLPDMDGMEVIRQIKDERPETEVIVITGYASPSSAVEAMKTGVVDYLPKPFSEEEFLMKVEKALEMRQENISNEMLDRGETEERRMKVKEPEGARSHVLVMEDESSVAEGLRMVLEEKGYAVDLATSGQGAIHALGHKDFDLLVADLRLPDMDGMEVISQVKENNPETEVIVITGYSDVSSAVEALRAGVSDYLAKPFTEEEFISTVKRTMGERRESLAREMPEPVETDMAKFTRIGCYICHCGNDITRKVSVDKIVDFARKQPEVLVARSHKSMCQPRGLEMIEKDIRALGLNRIVVAACSLEQYEKRFQEACRNAGLETHHLQMAPILEQVAWITENPAEATVKAKTLASAAIYRAKYHRTLTAREVSVNPEVLVVGGGIAGMQAALDVAEAGHKAYLVERQTTIGGHMLQFDKTFPTLDCAACIGTPKMVSVGQNPNIELLTGSEVREISGFVGNYRVKIHRESRYVKEGVCTGCGECSTVCPVTRPSEWDEGLAERNAIYRSFPQAVPITFAIEKKDRAPCVITCPAGINVQGYIQLIGQGKYMEAIQLIMERLPLPGVLGRVCPHPCEAECRRLEKDEAIAIRDLKRFAADRVDFDELPLPEIEDRPEKIAVVGSGPAGLTAAYYLRLKGYQVTILESLSVLGGMLRVGIPDYRLPPEVLDKEINHILRLGIETRTGQALGADFTISDLEKEGFRAILVAVGAHSSIKTNVPGEEEFGGILDAVDFLRDVNLGDRRKPGNRVMVIGGGNVAIDAARTAKRLGCEEVTVVYRRSRQEMPAYPEEIEGALEEGVKIHYLTAPVKIHGANGKVTGFECIKTELGEPDTTGRRRPVPLEGSEFVIECDTIIPAIGQKPDLKWVKDLQGMVVSKWGTLDVNPHTMQTNIPHVFATGDTVSGPSTVIEAVAGGHMVVEAMDRYLSGKDLDLYAEKLNAQGPFGRDWCEIPDDPGTESRVFSSCREPENRVTSFNEVDLGLSEDAARQEARRCLNCGVCSECMECVKICEADAIDHIMGPEEREIEVGTIILATGFDITDPTPMKEYGYGRYPNVLTSFEFERLNNATGPTDGKILLRDEKGKFSTPPESVGIIHCVGSRDENYHEYCSRVCCMYALKYGHLLKDKVGHHVKVYDFYVDMRCFGKGYEEFYKRCQEEGIIFFRGKPAEITRQPIKAQEEGRLIIIGEDTLMNRQVRIPVDMVILCAAMEARKDAAEMANIFGINQDKDGFFKESHSKLGPLNSLASGIFLAGACQGPKDIPDTVSQASGAAAKALELAIHGKAEIPSTIAWIDRDLCKGCLTCIKECRYMAIEFNEWRGVSMVNQAICKGCGDCVNVCPNGAAHIWQFSENRILTEHDGIMEGLQAVGM